METNWEKHYQERRNRAPAPILATALTFVENKAVALDLGTGDFVDSRYLIKNGFSKIVAVDKGTPLNEVFADLPENIEFIQSSFDKFEFPEKTYDFILANYSLPFTSPEHFEQVWEKVKKSLAPGGVFAGQFFGVRDGFNAEPNDFTFHTEEDVKNLFLDMVIVSFEEREVDRHTEDGEPKHWHVFEVIAKAK